MFMLLLFILLRRRAEPTPFLSQFFHPPEASLFWRTSVAITSLGLKRYFWLLWGGSIRLGLLLWPAFPQWSSYTYSSPSLPWHLLCLSFLVLSCSWEVLQDLGSDHLPILLTIIIFFCLLPQQMSPFLYISDWLCLLFLLSLFFCRGIFVSFSFLCCFLYLSDTECSQIFHFCWPH